MTEQTSKNEDYASCKCGQVANFVAFNPFDRPVKLKYLCNHCKNVVTKCHSQNCNKEPTSKVFWPGEAPFFMCEECKTRAVGISNVMGFKLHTEDATELINLVVENL